MEQYEGEENQQSGDSSSFYYDDEDIDLLIGIQRTQAIALIIVVCVSLISNISVLYILASSGPSNGLSTRVCKHLMVHLCVGDLIYAMFTIVPRTINIMTFPRFYGGYFLCRFVKFLQLIPVYACPFLMVMCCIERYCNIRKVTLDDHSINRRRISWRLSRSFVHVMAFWAWLSAMVLSTPNILSFRYEYLDETGTIGTCLYQIRESYEHAWMTFLTCATWIVPLCMTILLFSLSIVRYFSTDRISLETVEQLERREQLKLLKFIAVIIVIKYSLWTPFNVTNLVGIYWRSIEIGEKLSLTVTLACNCACCVSSIAYLFREHGYVGRRIQDSLRRYSRRVKSEERQERSSARMSSAAKMSLQSGDEHVTACKLETKELEVQCPERSAVMFMV